MTVYFKARVLTYTGFYIKECREAKRCLITNVTEKIL